VEPNEIATLVDELEDRVERLRAIYDQYFMGIERLEPLILKKDVERRIHLLRREQVRNTAMRFRLQTAVQRYNTFQQYWQRICREIENGTYTRDLARAAERFGDAALTAMGRKRQKMFERGLARRAERDAVRSPDAPPGPTPAQAAGPAASPRAEPPAMESLDDLAAFAADAISALELELPGEFGLGHGAMSPPPPPPRPGASAAVAGARGPSVTPRAPSVTPRAPSVTPGGLAAAPRGRPASTQPPTRPLVPSARSGIPPSHAPAPPARPAAEAGDLPLARLREIYGEYVEAKRRCNESTAAITFEKLQANLRQSAKQLQDKHKGKHVDFEVVVRNGTAILKPIVKA
jgi:hypothetical protein